MNSNETATQGPAIEGTATWAKERGLTVQHDHIGYELMLGRGRKEVTDDGEAEALAKATGSVEVTIVRDHRDPATGQIVVDEVKTHVAPSHNRYPQNAPEITTPTVDREVKARALRELDLAFLSRIPVASFCLDAKPGVDIMNDTSTEGEKAAQWTAARLRDFSCVIAWEGEFGISIGVVRSRYPAGYGGRTEDTFTASPFPGGWCEVPLSRIVSVRASSTL